jgi:hypothetical protein
MSPLLVLVTTAALGVEVGWQPLPGGGHEYTIQIEPQLLGVLERGTEEIFSDVPPEIDVRRYRITVGTGQLPRDAGTAPARKAAPPEGRPPVDDRQNPPPAETDDPSSAPPPEVPRPDDQSAIAPPPSTDPTTDPGATRPPIAPGSADDEPVSASQPQPPGRLPRAGDAAGPIQAAFDSHAHDDANGAGAREAQKPMLPAGAGKPWFALVASVMLLCCSLGVNLYLGWIVWDARSKYRDAVAKLRTAS